MAPRLHHKKSRTGCTRCKKRRVKCNEEQPVCSACKRHNVACEYPVLTTCRRSPASPSNPLPSTSSKSPSTTDLDIPLAPDQRRVLELHLLQHFTSCVSRDFPAADDEPTPEMWCNHVVGMAFEHPFLLNSIFSLAALHIDVHERAESREPKKPPSGFQAAMRRPACPIPAARAHGMYFNAAAKQQREALANVSAHNGNALWMTTIVLSLQAVALTREDVQEGMYRSPLNWLRMIRGIADMEATVRPFARPTTLLDFVVERESSSVYALLNRNEDSDLKYPQIFDQLDQWDQHYGEEPEHFASDSYKHAVDFMRLLYRIARGGNFSDIFRYLLRPDAITTTQFLMFIENRRPRAYIILACYCAMTMSVDNNWVFHGMASREVRGIHSLIPPQWRWAMEWPLQVINTGKVL